MATATATANRIAAFGSPAVAKRPTAKRRESGKRKALRAKITELADLDFNWDGEQGHAPVQVEIDNALSFIDHIPEAGLASVSRCANGDGEISFGWETPQHSLGVSFLDGEITFTGDLPNGGGEVMGCERYNKNTFPKDLRRLLEANFPASKVEDSERGTPA